jgi:anaerobic ribonucleoside-triphosphate reductase activating protein
MAAKFKTQFNLAHLEPTTHIYGPGRRFGIWLQGCSLACNGCWNKQMWSFKANQLIERELLLENILLQSGIEGITILGGEPLEQADNIIWLIKAIKKRSLLTVMLYTGFTKIEIKDKKLWTFIHENVDLLISGRYEEQNRNINNQWYGSDNQELIYPRKSRITQISQSLNEVEIIIEASGEIRTLGYPDVN